MLLPYQLKASASRSDWIFSNINAYFAHYSH